MKKRVVVVMLLIGFLALSLGIVSAGGFTDWLKDFFGFGDAGLAPVEGLIARYNFESDLIDSAGEFDIVDKRGGTYEEGKVGTFSYGFDGINDYLRLPDNAFVLPADEFTITAWVKPNTPGGAIFWEDEMQFYFSNDGTKLRGRVYSDVEPIILQSDSSSLVGEWTHIAFSYIGDNGAGDAEMRLYEDGIMIGMRDLQGYVGSALGEGVDTFSYLGRYDVGRYYNGSIDDLRIYNRALSEIQIGDLVTCIDLDGDGYGESCGTGKKDCDDGDSTIHYRAEEVCGDGKDNNCNNVIDDNCVADSGVIVDNEDVGSFSTVGIWDTSQADGFDGSNSYRDNSVFSKTVGESAKWTANLAAGVYHIYVRWTYLGGRTDGAPYFVGEGVVRMDQSDRLTGNSWQRLGTEEYTFDGSTDIDIRVESTAGHSADAVSFVKIRDLDTGCVETNDGVEICDGVDNNCDGEVDEGVKTLFYLDGDGDGFGAGDGVEVCLDSSPADRVPNNDDCNDADVNLGELKPCVYDGDICGTYDLCVAECVVAPDEICGNDIDENCNGLEDDVCSANLAVLDFVSPAENATYTNRLVPFEFKAEGALGCSYILDSENETDAECERRESLNLDAGEHVIEVIANNSIGEERESRTFEVVSSRRFAVDYNSFYGKGDTTDLDELSDTDLAVLKNFTLENKYGKIEFLETIDLKEAANVMTDVINIDSNILIGNNSVEVKSDVVSSFNKKARVSLKDLTLDDPRILKDEEVCYDPECEIESYFNGTLVFMVKGFTVYMAEETPDTPDNETEGECFDDIDCSFGEICNDDNECVVSVEPPEPPVPPEPPEPGVECVFDIDCDSGKICNEDSECVEEEKPVNTRFIILIVVLIVVMLIIVGLIIYVVKKQDGGSSRQSEEHSRRGKRDNGGGGRGNGSFSGSNFVIKAKPASGRRGPTPSTHR